MTRHDKHEKGAPTLADVMAKLEEIRRATLIGPKDVLTIEEAAAYTGYSVSTLYALVHRREVPHWKRGARTYFEKAALASWLLDERRLSPGEISELAEEYCARHPLPEGRVVYEKKGRKAKPRNEGLSHDQ